MSEVIFLRDVAQYKVYAKRGRFFVGAKDPERLRRLRVDEADARAIAAMAKSDVAVRIEGLLGDAKRAGSARYYEVVHTGCARRAG